MESAILFHPRGDAEEFGPRHVQQAAGLREHYPEQKHHYRVLDTMRAMTRHWRPSPSHDGRPTGGAHQGARGDFTGYHRMASTHDSNDEDGETSSASEDSSTSAGYPSPQARGRRPSKRAEPCAGIRQLPPAQRARLQLKETESLVHARWSPASSGYAVATPPATVAQERDSPRQLPRLAALEETCQQHQQQQIPQNAHQQKQVQQQQQRPVGSGALSVASLMQLPSLVATGRTSSSSLSSNASNSSSKTLREAAAAAAAGVTAAAAVAAAVATSPVTAPHSSPTLPSAQGLQHVGSRNHVVLSAGMNLQQPTPLEGWSLNERRQVPRMETLGRAPSPATAAAAVAEARMQQRRWDPAYSSTAVPTGGFAQGAYGGVDRCDSRHQHESGWARHAYSTVAPGFGWEAGCRRQYEQQTQAQQQQTALAAGATTTRGAWTQQTLPHAFHSQQEQEQQCFRQQHRIQNQPHDTRYGAQPMQPNKVLNRPEIARAPSSSYRVPTPPVLPTTADRPKQEGWTRAEDETMAARGGEQWAPGAPRPANGQASKHILQRYLTHLNPKASREVWSHDEEEVLWRAQHEYGNAWNYIAGLLPGRSENAVKNHWYTQMRMFIGQRNSGNTNLKSSSPSADSPGAGKGRGADGATTSGPATSSARSTRQSKAQKKLEDEKTAGLKRRSEVAAAAAAAATAAAAAATATAAAKSAAAAAAAAAKEDSDARVEDAARAEAVAALGLLFSQGVKRSADGVAGDAEVSPSDKTHVDMRKNSESGHPIAPALK